MNKDLADLLAAVFLEEPACAIDVSGIVDEIEMLGLHEVPRYAPLVAAMKAAVASLPGVDLHNVNLPR